MRLAGSAPDIRRKFGHSYKVLGDVYWTTPTCVICLCVETETIAMLPEVGIAWIGQALDPDQDLLMILQ